MKRPLLLRVLPTRLQIPAYARLYKGRHHPWVSLYESSVLRFAPTTQMDLLPGDMVSDAIAFTGLYELDLTRRLADLSRRGGLFVDVGANIGYFTLLWLAGNPANRAICVEASPRNIGMLRRNLELNDFSSRAEVYEVAAGAEPGVMSFDPGPEEQTGWGGFSEFRNSRSFDVSVRTLDSLLAKETHVDLMKIDIEGADTLALRGAEKLLRRKAISEVWYEQFEPRMKSLGIARGEAQAFLGEHGYSAAPQGSVVGELIEWRATPE